MVQCCVPERGFLQQKLEFMETAETTKEEQLELFIKMFKKPLLQRRLQQLESC